MVEEEWRSHRHQYRVHHVDRSIMEGTRASQIVIISSALPNGDSIVFKESSYFTKQDNTTLPSPSEVRSKVDKSSNRYRNMNRAQISLFPDLGLLVKWGPTVTVAEAQCLWVSRTYLPNEIPVPELYGWCIAEGQTFIYMQLVEGMRLDECWDSLSEESKENICLQLKSMVRSLRLLKQDEASPFIGRIDGQSLLDTIFTSSCSPTVGPFSSVQAFLDFFTHLSHKYDRASGEPPHPYRSELADDVPIIFTHGDLHPSNILISVKKDGTPRVVSIIDWHQAGWYPEYWEYCKARWTARVGSEWETKYLTKFLEPYDGYHYWDYFVLSLGV